MKIERTAEQIRCPKCKKWFSLRGCHQMLSGQVGIGELNDLNSGGIILCDGCFKAFIRVVHAWIEGRIKGLGN